MPETFPCFFNIYFLGFYSPCFQLLVLAKIIYLSLFLGLFWQFQQLFISIPNCHISIIGNSLFSGYSYLRIFCDVMRVFWAFLRVVSTFFDHLISILMSSVSEIGILW